MQQPYNTTEKTDSCPPLPQNVDYSQQSQQPQPQYPDMMPHVMPQFFIGAGGMSGTGEYGDDDDDESSEESGEEETGNPHGQLKLKSEKSPWYVELVLVAIIILSVVFAVFIVILQFDSPGSVIMTLNMILAMIFAILSIVAAFVRCFLLCKKGLPVVVIYLLLAIIIYVSTFVITSTILIMVFKQATEDFWTLFVSLSGGTQAFLILSFVAFLLIFVLVTFYFLLRRRDLIEYINKTVELSSAETYKKSKKRKRKLPRRLEIRIISETIAVRRKWPGARPTVIPVVKSDRHAKDAKKKRKKRKKKNKNKVF
jgi:hypothetical protein